MCEPPRNTFESGRDNAVGFHTDTRICQGPISADVGCLARASGAVCTGQMETGAVYSHRSRLAPSCLVGVPSKFWWCLKFLTQGFKAFVSGQAPAEFTPAISRRLSGKHMCAPPCQRLLAGEEQQHPVTTPHHDCSTGAAPAPLRVWTSNE